MSMRGPTPIRILLIEDEPGDVKLLRMMLIRGEMPHQLETVASLSDGIALLDPDRFDIVLMDLGLPESRGLDSLIQMLDHSTAFPIVVITGANDELLAQKALQVGAQDYLVKGQFDRQVLVRAIRYAIERHHLLLQHEELLQKKAQQQELRSLERLSLAKRTAITAQMFGDVPLRESLPEHFDELVQDYTHTLDLALERLVFKKKDTSSDVLQTLADRLGFLGAGPRDVLDMHISALKQKVAGMPVLKAQSYTDEGRLIVLKVMGYLVSYYRNRAVH